MTTTLERRFIPAHVKLVRSSDPTRSSGQIVGYAAAFSTPGQPRGLSSDLGGFRERVGRTAFDRSLSRGDDVYCAHNHDPSRLLGRTKNGTLKLSTDSYGLRFACDMAPTSVGRDAAALIERGDMTECSFGFVCDPDGESWDDEEDEGGRRVMVRTLRSVRLFDVSSVTSPAYGGGVTSVSTQADSTPPFFNSARSFDQLFPTGLPAEVRTRIPNARAQYQRDTSAARRRLTNMILGI